ncbi:mucin-6 [Physeter macrocephalus]|uniref:Mucin-6 n=1 Tax=Physeter macrocephalus TaxID=9755 RepID=A0A2Y9TAT2_PHYMC|nr:mucin-6 [Physeter catodon]|eukprot:XP_023987358.1 mucin-6 [Physeter catodon]
MLRSWLLFLCCGGALLSAGLDDSSLVPPGLQRLKDSPQTAVDRGWCSTWGAGHFSTFDGHVYDFSGTCNYVFAAMCKDASSTFSVQLRRGPSGNISRVIVELGASVVTVQTAVVSVKDVGVVSLPYTSNGLQITPFGQSVRLVAKQLELELVVMWGPGAHLMVLVEKKHMGKMCGLCGNFDGEKTNEFLSEDGQLLEPPKYAALQKLDDPNEICAYEAIPSPRVPQAANAQACIQLLTLVSPECNVPKEPFLLSCQADMAACAQPGRHHCSCATLSEYSRQCSMAGQPVNSWRGPGLCSVGQCPANQVYRECGETCVRTCSNPQHGCSSSCTFGCFCPEGMVLDDISKNHSCVPVPQCPCMLSGVVYAPGEVTTAACHTCRCSGGHWECVQRPCPRRCALEGGSFVTTFDARPYRFHGTCTYILLQSPLLPDGGSLMAVYDKSGYSHSETSLVAVIYVSSQDKIVISQDEVITNNGDTKWLPYKTRNITVFRQTSTHVQMVTTFGLELVIQMWPVFQVYITVGPQFRGQTRGLCGNFNGDTTDDFTTSMGIAEGTASLFVDSWRAGNCPAALERETDPCSMSQLNKVCAETHCAVLVKKGSVFEKCHAAVDPKPFYKRCVYQACNYEETFPHICAALGDYALACTSRGVLLRGWRGSVDNCSTPCTGNQTFSYDSQACDRTCLSLSDREVECHPSAVPVDGCNCPEGTYLNHKTECVRKAQCPCLLDSSKFILANQSTTVNGVICYCVNGRLSCPAQPQMLLATCSAPKTFQSCSQSSEDKFGAACAPTCQMLATGTPCVPTKCEPGCVCAKGLYENARGQCVPPEECPCEFAGASYPQGAELHTDCKSCTCSRGTWTCQQSAHCPSTCALYGEGHVVTFDGQRFVFDGNCEYILATDSCGASDSQPTFKILTENVVCGKSGVTCSRAIKIFLGGLSITLADRNYTVSGEDPGMHFRVKAGSLHLVLDATISSTYNLTLIWNKHMTVFIKIARASQDALCGLCGNYNGNMKDDFQTRSGYLASSELDFVNSWKESPLCGDATFTLDPCSLNTFRRSWAERRCSIINSQTFAACHGQVYRLPYYEACVRDACGCDTGGDCECLCDAVAAYAKACVDKGVCVDWRSPDFCPIYCDFYNTHTQAGGGRYRYAREANCTWHYQPCLCPAGPQSVPGTNIEGCYNCSQDEYFDHDKGTCLPCSSLPATETRPTTATASTTVTPSTTGLSSTRPSPSSPATPEAPTRTPSLPATPTATATAPTTQTQPTVPSGHKAPRPGPRGGFSSNHLHRHHTGHIGTGLHGTHRDPGHNAAHRILPRHSHAVHSSVHGANHSSPANPGNIRDLHSVPCKDRHTHSPATDKDHNRDRHTHIPSTDKDHNRDHHTQNAATDKDHSRDHHTHSPATDKDHNRDRHTHSPSTDKDHNRDRHTHIPSTDKDHNRDRHTHSHATDKDHNRDHHTQNPATDKDHNRDRHSHSPATDKDHNRDRHTHSPSTDKDHNRDRHTHIPSTDKDHNRDCHTHSHATDTDHNRDHHTQNPATYKDHNRDRHSHSPTTDKDHNRDRHTHSSSTDKDHNRDRHTHIPSIDKDHNRDRHTHSHATDKDHNRDHHTQNPATDKDHNRDRHTHSPATDKDHNRDRHTHIPSIDKDHNRDRHTHSHATDKDHNRDRHTHSHATDKDHNRDCHTHSHATDKDHNRDRHTQNPATDKDHNRDRHTHSPATDKDHNSDRHTHIPSTDKDHKRDHHTQNPATDKDHSRDHHTHSPSTDKDNRDRHTHIPSTDKDHNRDDRHSHSPTTDKDHNRDHHTHSPSTDKDHNRDRHTHIPSTDKDHNRDRHTHSHATDKDHNRDHHTQNPATYKDHNRDHHNRDRHTQNHATDKDHNRDRHTQNPTTDKDHDRDRHTHSPATGKDYDRDRHTHSPATDKDHDRDRHTHSPATDKDHDRDRHTHSHATDKDHDRDRHTHNPATDKDHNRDRHTHSLATYKDHNRDRHTHSHATDKDHNRDRHTQNTATDKDHYRDHRNPELGTATPRTPPLTKTTTGTTGTQNSVSTATTSTVPVSHSTSRALHVTTSPPFTTISLKSTSRGTGTPVTHTATATHTGPHTPFTTHSIPTRSVPTTSHTIGPSTGTSFQTTTTYPITSHPETLPTHVSTSATSSVTPISHQVITATRSHTTSTIPKPTGTPPTSTHVPVTETEFTPTAPPLTKTTTRTTQAQNSVSTALPQSSSFRSTLSSPTPLNPSQGPFTASVSYHSPVYIPDHSQQPHLLSSVLSVHDLTVHLSHDPSPHAGPPVFYPGSDSHPESSSHQPHHQTAKYHRAAGHRIPDQLHHCAWKLLLSHFRVLFHQGFIHLLSRHISTRLFRKQARAFPQVIVGARAGTSGRGACTPGLAPTQVSVLQQDCPPLQDETCSVRESEEEVTYQGCTANVTVTRCEGVCASSASFNTDTMHVDTSCSCCHPLSSHEKRLALPCPDPRGRGQQLMLTLQMFSSCTCRSQRCGD